MTFLWLILLPFLGWSQESISGSLYELKSNQEKKLFTSSIQVQPVAEGELQMLTEYRDLQGGLVVREKGRVRGADILSYEMERPQTGEKGSFRVEKGRVYFHYEDAKGKKKAADEKVDGFVLATSNFNAFVIDRWESLKQGKALDVRFAVWDRLETVGFTLQKMGEADRNGQRWMELRLKPTSFIIAAIVDPIHLWYSVEDRKLRLMKGRVAPKQKKDGSWKDLDAEVVYTYDLKSVSN